MKLSCVLVVALSACGSSGHSANPTDAGVDGGVHVFTEVHLPVTAPKDLDLLFVVDNSSSMADKQANLIASFPKFIDTLARLPGGLPNLHIGVVTTDMGTRGALDASPGPAIGTPGNGGCAGNGNAGAMRANGAPITGVYLSDVAGPNGTRITNYPATSTLSDVFGKLAQVGDIGCGFEQPLESMKQALLPTNVTNQGFLRPQAALGVVIVSDEDDCSLAHSSLLSSTDITLGPLQSFRCTQFGVTCDIGGKTTDDMAQLGVKAGCHPSDDTAREYVGRGFLTDLGGYAKFLKGLKTDPSQIAAALLTGNPAPVATELRAPNTGAAPIPALAHQCVYNDAAGMVEVADPAVRLTQFLAELGPGNRQSSICQIDLSDAMSEVAYTVRAALGVPCFHVQLLDADAKTAGLQTNCTVTVDGTTALPACAGAVGAASNPPCYRIVDDASACGAAASAKLDIEGLDKLAATASIVARCEYVP